MATRNGASFAGRRLEKLAEKQQKAVEEAQEAASRKRTAEGEYYGEENGKKRKKSGKQKGDTHGRGRGAERETFGSADLLIDTRSLSAAEKASLLPGDDPLRDGVGSMFARDAPSPGIDPRGQGKNGERVEDGSGSDNSEEENSPLQRRNLLKEAVIEKSQWQERHRDMGRSPQREARSTHRSQGDVLAIKSRSGSGSGSAVVEQQLAIRQGARYENTVAVNLIRPKRGEEISTERAMAVACLQGNCNEAEMYPSREKLVYWRAVLEGMEPTGLDGMPNDPKEYFENGNNYNYLVGEHLKACSSKRGELAGKKGIRGVFETKTTFNMARAKTPLEVMAMTALAEGLSGGRWHTDGDGVPFASDTFVAICRQVWRKDDCSLTAEQLVWTCLVVDHFLQSKLFDRSDAVNADLLDSLAVGVLKVISDAKKAKKPIKAKVVPNDKEISLAQLTAAYLDEGMHCINRVGEKKERRRRGAREPRNRAAFEELARLASEEPTETVDAEEAPETVEPAA